MQKKGKKGKKGARKEANKDATEGKNKKGSGRKRRDVPQYATNDADIYGELGDEPDPEMRDFYYDEEDEFHEGQDQARENNGSAGVCTNDADIYGDLGEEPDPEMRDFYYDEEDEFHEGQDQILLEDGYQYGDKEAQSDEEEVMALDSEESDDDEIRDLKAKLREVQKFQRKSQFGSDLEDESSEGEDDEEAGLPDSKAWGKKRRQYYGDDDVEVTDLHDEEAEANLEEKEALKLQKKLAEQLDDQDFGLDIFTPQEKSKDTSLSEEKIVKDLSKLSKREKLKILKKKSPELLTLIDEFKDRMKEVVDSLGPMKKFLEGQKCKGKAMDYINTKFRLNLNYCTNIIFYLILKAKQIPVHNHPVIKRLLQHKNMLKQLEPIDASFKDEMTEILTKLKNGETVELVVAKPRKTFIRRKRVEEKTEKRKLQESVSQSGSEDSDDLYEDMDQPTKKKPKDDRYLTEDEKGALEMYEMMKAGRQGKTLGEEKDEDDMDDEDNNEYNGEMEEEGEEEEGETKRAITYQIQKNKGLTAHKKKELRNPRVKHRMKYRKAKIRRKGQVQEVRREIQKYGGEMSGIRATVAKSIKLKN